ncbi:MAG: uracil-DNA glycosylase [Oscillibacter sp.]|nr:uracil-DNA glycosylase [Oscillibacter sp.]
MKHNDFANRIPEAWAGRLAPPVLRTASELWKRAAGRRAAGETVLPPQGQIFRALELAPPENVRCVIVGQDPYHTPGVANGLAFSANPGCKIPPSLRNIFKELSSDLGCPAPTSPDLTPWAERGVLLLNATLTVRAGAAGSHAAWGWQSVTEAVLRACLELPQPAVFLLWGRHAQSVAQKAGVPLSDIDAYPRKRAICSSHPSPLGASKAGADVPAFLGSRPFSRANAFLRASGAAEIEWGLP